MAELVRQAYVHYRRMHEVRQSGRESSYLPSPKWDGGEAADGRVYDPIWPKIAIFMLRHGLNPVQCVQYLFDRKRVGTAPMPNQIALPSMIPKYRSLDGKVRQGIVNSFESEKQRFTTHLRINSPRSGATKFTWTCSLISDAHGCSALFRYCLAKSEDLEIAERFEDAALMQYMAAPDVYDETWGEWIPEDLKGRYVWH
jgi:hypothetical protein